MTPKTQATKEIIIKMDFIKIKNFCASKHNIKKVKRQPTEWEKVFANHVFDKEYLSNIYKELLQYNSKKDNQILKWAKNMKRHFSKEYIQMTNKHMKRCSTSGKCKSKPQRNTSSHLLG